MEMTLIIPSEYVSFFLNVLNNEVRMAGWQHRHNEHGFGWTLGVGDGQ